MGDVTLQPGAGQTEGTGARSSTRTQLLGTH